MAKKLKTFPVVTCTVSGDPYPAFPTTYFVDSLTIYAEVTNTGNVYVGDSSVSSATGIPIAPGDTAEIDLDMGSKAGEEISLDDVFVVSSTSGNKVRLTALVRKP